MSLVVNALLWGANVSAVCLAGIMKIPQLFTLAKAKSSSGVSLPSLMLELTGYSIMMSYFIHAEYSLPSYMEYPLLIVQDIISLLLILYFNNSLGVFILAPAGIYFSMMAGIALGYFPTYVISFLVNLCTPLSASSKLVQFYAILSSKSSKGVSILTWTISAYTSLARLFTVYIETFDIPLMINFGLAFFLNSIVIFTAWLYRTEKDSIKKKN